MSAANEHLPPTSVGSQNREPPSPVTVASAAEPGIHPFGSVGERSDDDHKEKDTAGVSCHASDEGEVWQSITNCGHTVYFRGSPGATASEVARAGPLSAYEWSLLPNQRSLYSGESIFLFGKPCMCDNACSRIANESHRGCLQPVQFSVPELLEEDVLMDNFGNVRIRRVPEAEVSLLENVPILSLDEARAEHAQRMNTLLSYRSSAWGRARDDILRGLLARARGFLNEGVPTMFSLQKAVRDLMDVTRSRLNELKQSLVEGGENVTQSEEAAVDHTQASDWRSVASDALSNLFTHLLGRFSLTPPEDISKVIARPGNGVAPLMDSAQRSALSTNKDFPPRTGISGTAKSSSGEESEESLRVGSMVLDWVEKSRERQKALLQILEELSDCAELLWCSSRSSFGLLHRKSDCQFRKIQDSEKLLQQASAALKVADQRSWEKIFGKTDWSGKDQDV